jgi:hypothetical protein
MPIQNTIHRIRKFFGVLKGEIDFLIIAPSLRAAAKTLKKRPYFIVSVDYWYDSME